MLDQNQHNEFVKGYISAALWSSNDDNMMPLDANFSDKDINEYCKLKIKQECLMFEEKNATLLAEAYQLYDLKKDNGTSSPWFSAGIDFLLSRNKETSGFKDRGEEEVWQKLQEASEQWFPVKIIIHKELHYENNIPPDKL